MTSNEGQAQVLLADVARIAAEVYDPAGVLMVWASPNRIIEGRRPCDAWRDRDCDDLRAIRNWLDSCADGNFA